MEPGCFPSVHLKSILIGKKIMDTFHGEGISDLSFEFEGNIHVDVFPASGLYEGWQLSGDDGILLVALPGGE